MTTNNKDSEQSSGDNVSGDKINPDVGNNANNVIIGKGNTQITVETHNQMGGQTAYQITNVGPQSRRSSQVLADDLVAVLLKYPPEEYRITSLMGDGETYQLASAIEQILKRAGWKSDGVWQGNPFVLQHGVIIESSVESMALRNLVGWMVVIGLKHKATIMPGLDKIYIFIGPNPN